MPSTPHPASSFHVAIVGGGPAGLMAAETLAAGGVQVDVFDAMPSVGRKFLLAGKGGLNITHSEAFEAFGPDALRAWVEGLGVSTFVGSSGRVFPAEMKAAPLLRAWLARLRGAGVRFHPRHRWTGWGADGSLLFTTPSGPITHSADATLLALGGGSWARLGSDGAWCRCSPPPASPWRPCSPPTAASWWPRRGVARTAAGASTWPAASPASPSSRSPCSWPATRPRRAPARPC